MTITTGMLVSFAYTLKGDDGTIIDTSEGGEPFIYTHGQQQVVPGLEKELEGMKVGESKDVTVSPEEAYGSVSEEARIEVPIENIPEEARVVGTRLQGTGQGGQPVFPVVKEVREDVVVLDFNHPLAGQTLHFQVEILTIEKPEAGMAAAGGAPGSSPQE